MNHEFWNEIGNLYFLCGAYEPAIHAYLRSIKLEGTFGRSYSNLAMVYVQTGKYTEAIKLYRRSIELLSDEKEKATTWNRLGVLYRQIKEYDNALEAYQRADLILPHKDAEPVSEIRHDAGLPLTVSMPEIDLDAILAKGRSENFQIPISLLEEINTEFEQAESDLEELSVEEVMVSPEFENYSQTEDSTLEPPDTRQSEWELAYAGDNQPSEESAGDKLEISYDELDDLNIIIPIELQGEGAVNQTQSPIAETQPEADNISTAGYVNEETDSMKVTQYLVTDSRSIDLSPEELQSLEMEIIKYKQATSKHPRNYALWEGLGEAHKSAGQYKDAILAFQKAISVNPTNPKCHYRLGLVYAAERKEQEAIKSFKKVLEMDPGSAQAHASLASQYRKMGFEESAREHIEKARSARFEEESEYNHACLEAICGNNDRALELLEVALQSKQTYITWAQNDPDLDSLRNDQRFLTLLTTHTTAA